MRNPSANTNAKFRALVAALFFSVAAGFSFYSSDLGVMVHSQARKGVPASRKARSKKYSAFPHDAKAHQIQCASCHKFPSSNWNKVRVGATAFPDITDYPKHESCLNCHRQQFFRGAAPVICSICHTNPGPRGINRHPFPNPREVFDKSPKGQKAESDFVIGFPHSTHIEIVTARASQSVFRNVSWKAATAAEESCSVCHQTSQPQGDGADEYITPPPPKLGEGFWLKKGTFKTRPLGHSLCFTCHSADSGIAPAQTDCATCHKLKPQQPAADFDARVASSMGITEKALLDSWRSRYSSGKFRHEWFSHAELSCATCHSVETMDTTRPETFKVPVAACATCHATATSDDGGVLNYEADKRKADPAFQCTKCHIAFGQKPIPASHSSALPAPAK